MKVFLKLSVVSSLIAIIFFGSTSKLCILLSYEINKLEIIEKFCINKEETSYKCDGKCYLKSELEKTEKNDDDSPFQNISDERKVLLYFQVIDKNTLFNSQNFTLQFGEAVTKSTAGFASLPLRPPTFG